MTTKLPPKYWETVKKYYPDYNTSKDILKHDILTRFINGYELSKKELKLIKAFKNNAKKHLNDLEIKIYTKAIAHYRCRNLN